MYKKLGSMEFCEEYLAEETVGHWVIENDEGKEPRMYVDDVMLGLIGLTEQVSPEDTFKAWLNGIDKNYLDSVLETERLNLQGIRAEVQYPWHYPDGRTILVRCEGIRNYAYEGGVRTEGRHRNITNLLRLQKETAIISALSGDFDTVDYILLNNGPEDDVTIPFRMSERIKAVIPGWEQELNFNRRLGLLVSSAGIDTDIPEFIAQTRRSVIIEHLEKEPAYFVNTRAMINGQPEHFQFKFTADRNTDGKLVGIVFGIHSIDSEMRQELETREKISQQVAEKTRELNEKNASLSKVNNRIIEMVGNIVESRDEESGNHINRVKYLSRTLALEVMKELPEYGLTVEDVKAIANLSPLHDVGKIAIPDSILLKPGKLTEEEYEVMKTHCEKGCQILEGMSEGWNPEYVKMSLDICRYHHEKWDGKGYPYGLKGDEIPIAAQIVSIADCYDALVSKRCYKEAYPHEDACRMIAEGECGQYSDKLLKCFAKCSSAFVEEAADAERRIKGAEKEELLTVTEGEYISDALYVLEKISESMPGGFFVYQADEDEKLIYFNDIMVKYMGCETREEFIEYTGNSFKGMVHPEDYADISGDIRDQIMDDGMDHIVYRIIRKDGSIRWLDDYGKFIHSEDVGDVFFVFVVDFTETYIRRDAKLNEEKEKQADAADNPKGALKNLKVMVVDDSDMAREIHCDLLEDEGASVTQACNGLEAVNLVKESMDYDLILMDLVMPVMSGVSAIREIKRMLDEKNRNITIICLTAEGSDMQVKEALEAGAFDCMYKPLRIPELSALIIAAIKENSDRMKKQLEETRKLANTDGLTHVKNIVAFTDKTADLASKLQEDVNYQFGAVVCDCDKLKAVNDSYGHNAGDKYICNASAAICETFKKSPVFRIGGDEFAVILEGADYKNAEKLMEELKGKKKVCRSLDDIKNGSASFAAGMAIYDRQMDQTIGDVIKRADAEMYKDKQKKK